MFYSGITLQKSVITKAAENERVLLQFELLLKCILILTSFILFYFL